MTKERDMLRVVCARVRERKRERQRERGEMCE